MRLQTQFRIGFLLISFLLASFSMAEAAGGENAISTEIKTQQTIKTKPSKRKRWLKKYILKKIKKKSKDETIMQNARLSLFIGIFSLIFLVLGGVSSIWFFLAAAIAAIIGDILSIGTLLKIRKSENPKDHRISKLMARGGLILSLLTGLIPLILLGLVLATL